MERGWRRQALAFGELEAGKGIVGGWFTGSVAKLYRGIEEDSAVLARVFYVGMDEKCLGIYKKELTEA